MKINEVTKQKLEPAKPRNFVAKNMGAATSGAGAHRDKKKELKQGKEKHKGKQYDMSESTPRKFPDPRKPHFAGDHGSKSERVGKDGLIYHWQDPRARQHDHDVNEEGENVAGTITSVTPDGKQVTMKKPDGTEVTTDASAFLPGPNNTVTINQPSPGDALKPGTVVQAQQPVGEEINDEEDPDLMGSGHNLHVGGDATDDFINDVRDKEYEKANRGAILNRLKHLAGLK